MINQQVLAGHWNEVRGKLKEKWAELTDDDLLNFSGDVDQLIGRIQQKTGETREAIEAYLDTLAEQGASLAAAARDKMAGVADDMRQRYEVLQEGFREGYAQAERAVQDRPGQALAVAFGAGLIVGVGVSLLLRSSGNAQRARPFAGRQLRPPIARCGARRIASGPQ